LAETKQLANERRIEQIIGREGETATFSLSQKRSFLTLSKSASRTIIFIDVQSSKTYPENKVSKAMLI
jgi:helix-turn-helix protein